MATRQAAAQLPRFLEGLPLAERALAFASERHRGQRRDGDGTPFVLHPLEAAEIVAARGWPEHVVVAALLHDVVEDTDAHGVQLRDRFGDRVARIVLAVSDCANGPYAERKAALRESVERAGREAAAVYAADKVSKVREVRPTLLDASPDDHALLEKLDHYRESLATVERVLGPGDALAAELRFELEAAAIVAPRLVGRGPHG